MMDIEALFESAPTTADGGEFVLFDKDQFVGQFHTADDAVAYMREHNLKRPFLCPQSILNFRLYPHIVNEHDVF